MPFSLISPMRSHADACCGWRRQAGDARNADSIFRKLDEANVLEVCDDVGVVVEGTGNFVDELRCYCFGVDDASCVLDIVSAFTHPQPLVLDK